MSIQSKIKRHFLIIEKVNRGTFPSFSEIKDYLEDHDFFVSHRTIQRDLEQIRNEFAIEVVYDTFKDGYYIDKEVSWNLETFTQILQTAISTESLLDNIQDSKNFIEYIDYGQEVTLQGMHYFDNLLEAVKHQQVLELDHENFSTGKITPYKLNPYLLKEYQKRWYVIGTINDTESIRTFGIDRLVKVKKTKETFKRIDRLNPKPYFHDIIGLNYTEKEVEEVIIKASTVQAKYLNTYPLHSSQEIIDVNEQHTTYKLHIGPNYEFRERILMLGANIEVVSPKWLRNLIATSLDKALQQYK